MVTINIEDMVQRGVHLGHPTSRWNPKMAPYIHTKRNGVYIIDLIQTASQLKLVSETLERLSAAGKTFLFVGTKRQATQTISRVAFECNSFYVNQRWLGGMLTNWKTIKRSLKQLEELEAKESSAAAPRASEASGKAKGLTKREVTQLRKQRERLEKYLGGLRGMNHLPDVVVVVGQREEMNAVLESQKLGMTTISVLDTDCDPTLTDYFVVANDDSIKSLEFVLDRFLQAILRGRANIKK